jgi:hypothetical protein
VHCDAQSTLGVTEGSAQGTGEQRAELDALLTKMTTKRTARAWHYREESREIMSRKQPNVVAALLKQWCTNVLR